MIYYAITPKSNGLWKGFTRYANEGDFEKVYDLVMTLTDDNHIEAANAESWCELASIGEVYEHDLFEIKIIED